MLSNSRKSWHETPKLGCNGPVMANTDYCLLPVTLRDQITLTELMLVGLDSSITSFNSAQISIASLLRDLLHTGGPPAITKCQEYSQWPQGRLMLLVASKGKHGTPRQIQHISTKAR